MSRRGRRLLKVCVLAVGCGSKSEPMPIAEQRAEVATPLVEAEVAERAGSGRDASVDAAKLAILRKEYDAAIASLEPVVTADPSDAVARYNLALAHQHKGDYNQARNGYLAALKADPLQADARYNLAVLCFERGIVEEARHHVAKFRSSFVDDPRGPALERMVGGAASVATPE